MMSDFILCGPCGYAENKKNAMQWCTVCEEGLCVDCDKVHKSIKTTRDHMFISIEDYQQIKGIFISLNCEDHTKRLELYCKTHDVAVCLGCVPSRHGTCPDVIPLDKASENAKKSTALADLEDTLTKTVQNLQHLITDRDSALKNLDEQRQVIKKAINDTRYRIMEKIMDLEQKLLLELDMQQDSRKSEVDKLLNRLKGSERDLCCLREQTSQLKSFASDIQIFLGTRQINQSVIKEVESVREEIKSLEISEVYLQLHPSIVSLINEVDQFGEISVKKNVVSMPFIEANVDKAQVQLRDPTMKSIENVRIELKERFEVKQKGFFAIGLTGCTMLSNGNLLFANVNGNSVLIEYSEDGQHIRGIPCSGRPFDLTVIDTDRIAVTYGYRKYLEIFNMKNNSVERKVEFESDCYGISYQDNKLFIISGGIVITDIDGKTLKTFFFDCEMYIETTKDRIYFTTKKGRTVNCISMVGEEIWVYKEKSLVRPKGITVDSDQNVYVADEKSKSLIVIQHDGKVSRTLLTKIHDLNLSSTLHFNTDKNILLRCDAYGHATLYNLEW